MGWEVVATAVLGGLASSVIGNMMTPDAPQVAPPPEVKPPTPMPVAPGVKDKAKAEKTLAQQMAMTRASTILTGDNEKLG